MISYTSSGKAPRSFQVGRDDVLSSELLIYYRQIATQSFTVVDVETTGRYASHHRVIELSVLQATLKDGIQHHRTHLINPQTKIPRKISRFTGISQAMVDVSPAASEVLPDYLPLLNNGVLTAHNLGFDYSFLQAEYARLGTVFVRPSDQQLCTVHLSRLMLADLPSRRLPDLVKHFQFQVGRSHRAEADTLACWFLLKRLLTEILHEPDEILVARFAQQWIPLKEAATILGHTQQETQLFLRAAEVSSRFAGYGRNKTFMYRRGDVEQLFHERQHNIQLSCL